MNRTRILRGLRIATTVVSLIVCGVLIVLWVRSYWQRDFIYGPLSTSYVTTLESINGCLKLVNNSAADLKLHGGHVPTQWDMSTEKLGKSQPDRWLQRIFGFKHSAIRVDRFQIASPYWFPVLVTAMVAVAPWMKWKFSLRMLLIGITLIVVAFGLMTLAA